MTRLASGDYGQMDAADLERFFTKGKVQVVQVGHWRCWEWNGSKDHRGYGRFWLNGQRRPAHRVMWQYVNPVTFRLRVVEVVHSEVYPELDHRCNNRACIRPAHLKQVSHKGNHQARAERYWLRKLARRERQVRSLHPLFAEDIF